LNSFLTSKWTKAVVFVLCCVPFGNLLWRAFHNGLTGFPNSMDFGPNPIEFITHRTGDAAIRILVLTLAVTPLRQLLRQPQLIRFRRMLGLFAFFYACLHFATWIGLDKQFDWAEMWKDVLKRRFITVGFTALVLMVPLAVTSTAGMIRRLGGKRWRALHRLIYASAILAVIHYYWLVKSDVRKPLMYAAFLAVLLAWRLVVWIKDRGQQARQQGSVSLPNPAAAAGR
jgi:methionine sulfoxide reductase heme-binding subunit